MKRSKLLKGSFGDHDLDRWKQLFDAAHIAFHPKLLNLSSKAWNDLRRLLVHRFSQSKVPLKRILIIVNRILITAKMFSVVWSFKTWTSSGYPFDCIGCLGSVNWISVPLVPIAKVTGSYSQRVPQVLEFEQSERDSVLALHLSDLPSDRSAFSLKSLTSNHWMAIKTLWIWKVSKLR